jgi:DNA invertase Pin-like site-specific DNA recombinase
MPRTYQHLQLEERALIQTMLEQGYKPAAIALSLGRSRSTISRELSRNNYIAPSLPRPVGLPISLAAIAAYSPISEHAS